MRASRRAHGKLTENTILGANPQWSEMGHVYYGAGFKGLGRTGPYGRVGRQDWSKELRRVAGASGKVAHQKGPRSPTAGSDGGAPRGGGPAMDIAAQCRLDES